MSKKYSMSKEELAHFRSLEYAKDYLDTSLQQFIAAIITERLGVKANPEQEIEWNLDGNELVLEIHDKPAKLYKPTVK